MHALRWLVGDLCRRGVPVHSIHGWSDGDSAQFK